MSTRHDVDFDVYTERHYIKNFRKKYSERVWLLAENAIRFICSNVDELLKSSQCETIYQNDSLRLCKIQFAIPGTATSPKASGNRGIIVINENGTSVKIVLLYHKSDVVKSGNETVAWKKIVRDNFPEYRELIN